MTASLIDLSILAPVDLKESTWPLHVARYDAGEVANRLNDLHSCMMMVLLEEVAGQHVVDSCLSIVPVFLSLARILMWHMDSEDHLLVM